VSKTLGIDFIELATKALLGLPLIPQPLPQVNHVGVKVPIIAIISSLIPKLEHSPHAREDLVARVHEL
jgi:hypothetical protein